MNKASEAKKNLIAAARELVDLDFNLVPLGAAKRPAVKKGYTERPLAEVTAEALSAIRDDRSTGLGVVTNTKSLREHGGETFILTALELEGKATASDDFMTEWVEAAERVGATEIMKRLEAGWKERTPSGGVRWFLELAVPDEDYAKWALQHVVQKSATRGRETYAELLLDKHYVIIAPSFGQTHKDGLPWSLEVGGPTSIPVLTVTELHTLSALLTEVGDVRDNPTNATEVVDGRTREAMATFNRTATNIAAVKALTDVGWREVDTKESGEVIMDLANSHDHGMISIGGPGKPPGSLWTFSTSAEPFEAERWYSAFEVLAILTANGNYVAYAETLLNSGTVRLMPWPLMSRKRVDVFPDDTPTDVLSARISNALATAKHPTDATVPFALLEVDAAHNPLAVLSMTRDGGVHRWSPSTFSNLACAVVQPARVKKAGVTYLHALPPGVVEQVFPDGTPPDVLPTVRFVGSNPLILPDGRVVGEPGYHPDERALVTITKRDQGFWKTYNTPARPTASDAQRALEFLRTEVMSDFPWETAGDQARYVAYLLTAASRNLYLAAPAFVFDSSDRGTGKSKAAAEGRRIGFGSTAAQSVTYAAKHDEELKKEVVSTIMAGVPALHVDELPRGEKFTSRVMSEVITNSGSMTLRILGGNNSVAVPPLLVTVCGNNVELGADSNRRFISIRMVHRGASLAFERTGFRHADLSTWVTLNRPRLLAAIHTILSHGLQNPVDTKTLPSGFGSFEEWVRVVLGGMTHVTIDGQNAAQLVVDGRKEFMDAQDEEGEEWAPVMQAWVRVYGSSTWVPAKDAHGKLTKVSPAVELPGDLLPQVNQSDTGAARAWGRALLSRRSTAVRVDDVIYRFDVKLDSKRGNSFRVVTDSTESTTTPEVPTAMAASPASAPTKTKKIKKARKSKTAKPVISSDSDDLEVA